MPHTAESTPRHEPLYISKAFGIDPEESRLDFFDGNLLYDSPLFIDPFLIKLSKHDEERALFQRFSIFFEVAYSKAVQAKLNEHEILKLRKFLSFKEPKEIGLGFTSSSNQGNGLGTQFADAMVYFFLEHAASKLILKKDLYSDGNLNPNIFTVVTEGVGPDGISDLSACLIMDYLISYTQKQCEKYNIPLSELPVRQSFDFDSMSWTEGLYADLPENPAKRGEPVIFVPKRFLRAAETQNSKSLIIGVLKDDPTLSDRFHELVSKNISDISMRQVMDAVMGDKDAETILRKYIQLWESKPPEAYDFSKDALLIMDVKKFESYFKDFKTPSHPENCEQLLAKVHELIDTFDVELSKRDGWKDQWRGDKPNIEQVFGRAFRGMGFAYFRNFPGVTFLSEVGTGNGALDFGVFYKECRVAIELKKLANSTPTGKSSVPAYLHGIQVQLPNYVTSISAKFAIYITCQHYTGDKWFKPIKGKSRRDDSARAKEIEDAIPDIKKNIISDFPDFVSLEYKNIDVSKKPSASKI